MWQSAYGRGLSATIPTLLIAAAVGLTGLRFSGYRLLSVQSSSMVPAFAPGDAILVAPVPKAGLIRGQIISYHSSRNPNVTITHRLVGIDQKSGWLTTAGDARHSLDPTFPPRLLIGRASARLPGLGMVLDALHKPLGLALAIYLPALLVIFVEIWRLSLSYARPAYSARL